MEIEVYVDGGARGNPGPAAVGGVIRFYKEGKKRKISFCRYIGEATNNVAEYKGVIEALRRVKEVVDGKGEKVIIFMDSRLVVNQLNGFFKIKESKLRELAVLVRQLEGELGAGVLYKFVPREKNTEADYLVNKALNGRRG